MGKTTFIYALCDNNGIVRYVGKSDNPAYRLTKHVLESKHKRTHKEKWIDTVLRNGGVINYLILDEVSVDDWSFWEVYWICQIKSWGIDLVNGTSGGEGSDGFKGKKHSQETKLICAESNRKIKNRSHLAGEKNGRSKLKDYQIDEIFEKKTLGKSNKELALEYGINPKYVYQILKGIRRKKKPSESDGSE